MFAFIKKKIYIGSLFLSSLVSTSSLSVTPLNCISMRNQECKVKPEIINVNSNNPIFYPFSIKINVVIVIILIIHMQKFVFLML